MSTHEFTIGDDEYEVEVETWTAPGEEAGEIVLDGRVKKVERDHIFGFVGPHGGAISLSQFVSLWAADNLMTHEDALRNIEDICLDQECEWAAQDYDDRFDYGVGDD